MPALLLLSLLVACSKDEATSGAESYVEAMTPLLQDNDALAQKQISLAEGVLTGTLGPADIATRYDRDLVPAAGALRDRAKVLDVALPELAAPHALLVEAWSERAEAYLALLKTYQSDDLAGFDAAMDRNLAAKAKEEQYFEDVGKVLESHDAVLP